MNEIETLFGSLMPIRGEHIPGIDMLIFYRRLSADTINRSSGGWYE